MKHMLCFDHPTRLRTALDNPKTSDTLWFSIVRCVRFSVHAVSRVHVQTKELLFQECLSLDRGLQELSSAVWLLALLIWPLHQAFGSVPLLTQNTHGSCVSQRQEMCLGLLCYSTRFSSRKEEKTTPAGPQPEPQMGTIPIKPARQKPPAYSPNTGLSCFGMYRSFVSFCSCPTVTTT